MIYPDNFEHKIGFDQIRELLADRCNCTLGTGRVDQMQFMTDSERIDSRLDETVEMMHLMQESQDFPVLEFHDLREQLSRIRVIGTWLDEQDLLYLWKSLDTIGGIVSFLQREESEPLYPALRHLAEPVSTFPDITKRINQLLTKFGKLKDNASPELYRIRMDLANTSFSISRLLNATLKKAQTDGLVDKDDSPVMRDGRLVLPVMPAMKRKIRGIVHGESATGRTVYIEPEEVVEANNRIRELEAAEKREVIRILTAFTDELRPHIKEILSSYEFLADIDFIRAKALLSTEFGSDKPHLERKPVIDLVQAIHPLLAASLKKHDKSVVPLDLRIDSRSSILLISGPNAGGKSVCLKTVGLLQYMLQCGLPVPARSNSHMGIFRNIFIDIGDEQSIEDDLSTYSSHLLNMKQMMKYCDSRSLILIDEFGSGTEPNIGGAIAEAVLKRFNRSRTFGVITTHYQNLKQYAFSNEGIVNGAMLYDRHLMQPQYILQIGNPGSSFAVEIARKTGIPEDVIADASEIVGRDYINLDKYLQDIVRDKRYWESKRQNVHQKEKELDHQIARHEQEISDLQKERKSIIKEAHEKADQMIKDSNAMIENTIRTIKEAQAEKETTRLARQELTEFKQTLEENQTTGEAEEKIRRQMERIQQSQERRRKRKEEKKNGTAHKPQQPQTDPLQGLLSAVAQKKKIDSYKIGDCVRLKGQTTVGDIVSIDRSGITVEFGNIRTTVKPERLEPAQPVKANALEQSYTYVSKGTTEEIKRKKLNFHQDLDVRGMRGDEAIKAVTTYIDDAILVGMHSVRILHGTGNGILRQLIRQYLGTISGVSSFHDEHVQFGGSGITIVELG